MGSSLRWMHGCIFFCFFLELKTWPFRVTSGKNSNSFQVMCCSLSSAQMNQPGEPTKPSGRKRFRSTGWSRQMSPQNTSWIPAKKVKKKYIQSEHRISGDPYQQTEALDCVRSCCCVCWLLVGADRLADVGQREPQWDDDRQQQQVRRLLPSAFRPRQWQRLLVVLLVPVIIVFTVIGVLLLFVRAHLSSWSHRCHLQGQSGKRQWEWALWGRLVQWTTELRLKEYE